MKIPATVVTGFLGAGKTTLISALMTGDHGRRIALIVNEFGVGVDGDTLCQIPGCDDVVELANGCICCTVAEDFVPTIEALLARDTPPEHIVIETSGLALPQPLVRAFAWPAIRSRVTVDGVIAVVDGPALAAGRFAWDEAAVDAQRQADDALDHDSPLAELFEDQLACADLVLLNKADLLADPGALSGALAAKVRPGTRIVPTSHGRVPPAVLLGLGAEAEATDPHAPHHEHGHHDDHHHDHDHDEFENLVLALPPIADVAAFEAQLRALIRDHDLLRVKGVAAVTGKPFRLSVQAVGPRIDTRFDRVPATGTRLVLIGLAPLDRAALAGALGALPTAAE